MDEYGQFEGTVRIYEKEYNNHVISWKDGDGNATLCGPFEIEFGYLQGNQRESKAEPDDFARISGKLDRIGGLYVYRDGIRILPYGNSDIDWLEIEERRNKGFSYYFFSYRRIYGAVSLTRKYNGNLHEKAGREGFQKDKAYRQLKAMLENIFIQLAADFFRKDADYGDYFNNRKTELERLEFARRKREKHAKTKRGNLSSALDVFFQKTGQKLPETEIAELKKHINVRMNIAAQKDNPDEAAEELLAAENEANHRLLDIRSSYQIAKPRGVALTKQLFRDWTLYQQEQKRLEDEVFAPYARDVADRLGEMAKEARIYIDQRRRLQRLIKQVSDAKQSAVKLEANKLEATAGETRRVAINTARAAIQELQNVITKVDSDFARQDLSTISTDKAEEIRQMYESRIENVGRKNLETLGSLREMLAGIAENIGQKSDVSQLEMLEAMDEELQNLREQTDSDADLVQLGLAVAVINHEFEAAIKGIRSKLRELGSWARINDDLIPLYQDIRTNFDHLDAHLNLFTPLQRRLHRQRIVIEGSEINHYLRSLFDVRLKRHNIELVATQDFLDSKLHGFPSTIYPVFVNVIDNAIFWLKDIKGMRNITLDFKGRNYLISNTGPAIHKRDIDAIFEQGFSRKPGGRGLGLYISRKVLQKEGMDIVTIPNSSGLGTTFIIKWSNEDDHDGDVNE